MEKKNAYNELAQELLCPIFKELVDSAVIADDGFTYDKIALDQWLKSSCISPMIGSPLKTKRIVENKAITFLRGQLTYFTASKAHFSNLTTTLKGSNPLRIGSELKASLDAILKDYFRLSKPLVELYEELNSLRKKYPDALQVYVEYANMLRFGNETEKAIELLKEVSAIYPNCCIPKYVNARIVSVKGQPQLAKQILDEIMNEHSMLDHSLLEIRYLTTAYLNTRSKDIALDNITAYLMICPEDVRAQLNQVYIYFSLQDMTSLLKASKKFLATNGYDACVEYYRARALVQKGKKARAFRHFDTILKNSKEPLFLAQCLFDRALARKTEEEFPVAIEELQKAHAYYPRINADLNLADIYNNKKEYVEASKWINVYGERINKETDIFYLRISANIKENMGLITEAIQMYLKLIDLDGINNSYYASRIQILLEEVDDE